MPYSVKIFKLICCLMLNPGKLAVGALLDVPLDDRVVGDQAGA